VASTPGLPSSWQGRGFAVYAVDLRGRGKSEGERFYVEDVAEYVADLRGLIGIAKERHPDRLWIGPSICSATAPAAWSPAPTRSIIRRRSMG
jgi:pimeloyl-ACP methyl ester carboxylesterase